MPFLKSTKAKIIAVVALLSLASLVYLAMIVRQSYQDQVSWQEIKPGQDTKADVIAKLGQPVSASSSATGQEVLNYPAKHDFWPNQIFIKSDNQKVNLIKERLLNTNPGELTAYTANLGAPNEIVANKLSVVGYFLHVYSRQGIAVNANKDNGVVYEIWYFPPTTIENFKSQYQSEIGTFSEEEAIF